VAEVDRLGQHMLKTVALAEVLMVEPSVVNQELV
jgi:hypothetical protein